MENLEFWKVIAGNSGIVLLLGGIIMWLLKRLTSKEEDIKVLNEHIRISEKENLTTLLSINTTLDKLIDVQKNIGDKIQDYQKTSKDSIEDKIEENANSIKQIIDMKFNYMLDKFNH